MQLAHQPRLLSRSPGPWQHQMWPTGPLAYNMWPLWYPVPCWQGLPAPFFYDHELQPPSAATVYDHELQPPTHQGLEEYLKYGQIADGAERQQWLHDYVASSGAKDRESLLLHAAREFGWILRGDRNFKSRLGLAEYKYRNGPAKHRGKNPRRPRKDRSTSPLPKCVRVNQQLALARVQGLDFAVSFSSADEKGQQDEMHQMAEMGQR